MQPNWLSRLAPVLILLLALSSPAVAINNGQDDTENIYANVGAMVAKLTDGTSRRFCSGTLVSSNSFLTASHCVDGINSFGDQIQAVYVTFNPGDIFDESSWIAVNQMTQHPGWTGKSPSRNDVAVLRISEPVELEPATLAPVGFLDELQAQGELSRQQRSEFLVVGYGRTRLFPEPVFLPGGNRKYALAEFQNLRMETLLLNQVQAPGLNNGGTSFGDSGGPAFWVDDDELVLTSVTSWGDAQTVATDIRQRIDIPNVRNFIDQQIANFAVHSATPAVPEPSGAVPAAAATVALALFSRRRTGAPPTPLPGACVRGSDQSLNCLSLEKTPRLATRKSGGLPTRTSPVSPSYTTLADNRSQNLPTDAAEKPICTG